VTEEGISYLYKTEGIEERRRAIAAIAESVPSESKRNLRKQ
jgi:malonate decarboxylase alpha subunit